MQDVKISRLLDRIELGYGAHENRENGMCAMELVACIAGEPHNFAPACVSEILTGYTIRLNDHMNTTERADLKPFLPRLVGTSGGDERLRFQAMTRLTLRGLFAAALSRLGAAEVASDLAAQSSLTLLGAANWLKILANSDAGSRSQGRKFRNMCKAFRHAVLAADRTGQDHLANWNWCGGELGLAVADSARLAGIESWSQALQILETGIDATAGGMTKPHRIPKRLHLVRPY